MNDKELSKLLSLVLRHKPEIIKIKLDHEGWAKIDELILGINSSKNTNFNKSKLIEIVNTNDKKRFIINAELTKIRANQGHSVNISLNLESLKPPPYLYHGTSKNNFELIEKEGLKKGRRQYVHLSYLRETAYKVGSRHGFPIILLIESKKMSNDGFKFYLSENNVWLTDGVPPNYIKIETPYTNQSFYRDIISLIETRSKNNLSLKNYLINIYKYFSKFENEKKIFVDIFLSLLDQSFNESIVTLNDTSNLEYKNTDNLKDYLYFKQIIINQILDLEELIATGKINNEFAYFGLSTERGSSWYNFDPHTYLECAARGSFDGWDSEVNSSVISLSPNLMTDLGLENQIFEINNLSWEEITNFFICGQIYE